VEDEVVRSNRRGSGICGAGMSGELLISRNSRDLDHLGARPSKKTRSEGLVAVMNFADRWKLETSRKQKGRQQFDFTQ
jgi:hypothetical protein